jgi:hypothetical protein
MRWAGHVARVGQMKNASKILFGKAEWQKQLGRIRCRWEDNIKMNLREMGR